MVIMQNYTEKIVKGTIILFFVAVITSILGYGLRIFIARSLTVEEFGLFYSVIAFVSFFISLKDLGVGTALVNRIQDFKTNQKYSDLKTSIVSAYLFQFLIGLLISIALWVGSDYIAIKFFHNIEAKSIIQIMVIEFLLASTIMKPVVQGLQKIKAYSLIEMLRLIFVSISLIFLIHLGANGVAYSYVIGSLLVQIIFFIFIFKTIKNLNGETRFFDQKILTGLLSFGMIVFAGNIANSFVAYADTLFLTYFATLEKVGLYQAALSTSQLVLVFANALTVVLFPIISEMWSRKEKDKIASGFSSLLKFSFIFIIPVAFVLIAFPELVITNLVGEKYINASSILQILALGTAMSSIFVILTTISNSISKPWLATKSIVIVGTINVLLNIFFVVFLSLGPLGSAISLVISFFVGVIYQMLKIERYIEIKIKYLDFAKIVLSGFIVLVAIEITKGLLSSSAVVEASISLTIAVVIYTLLIKHLKLINDEDRSMIKNSNLPLSDKISKVF